MPEFQNDPFTVIWGSESTNLSSPIVINHFKLTIKIAKLRNPFKSWFRCGRDVVTGMLLSRNSLQSCSSVGRPVRENGNSASRGHARTSAENIHNWYYWFDVEMCTHTNAFQSGHILILHQPRFFWNKGISLPQLSFQVRSCEVAIIWPCRINIIYSSIETIHQYMLSRKRWWCSGKCWQW